MENHNYMLIADDAGEFRDTCKAALEAKGFEVEVCRKDGRALLDMIREKKPTAVLMEALMSAWMAWVCSWPFPAGSAASSPPSLP